MAIRNCSHRTTSAQPFSDYTRSLLYFSRHNVEGSFWRSSASWTYICVLTYVFQKYMTKVIVLPMIALEPATKIPVNKTNSIRNGKLFLLKQFLLRTTTSKKIKYELIFSSNGRSAMFTQIPADMYLSYSARYKVVFTWSIQSQVRTPKKISHKLCLSVGFI